MKDENGLHGVARLILAHVTPQGWVSAGATVIGCIYMACSIIEVWSKRP